MRPVNKSALNFCLSTHSAPPPTSPMWLIYTIYRTQYRSKWDKIHRATKKKNKGGVAVSAMDTAGLLNA